MPQIVKIVDITKSFYPGDPNAFGNNLHYTKQQDAPDEMMPIIAYEGYNFLPTSYGYRSYFGTTPAMTLDALPKPCDQIIVFQSKTYQNMLIAFCSDGIRTAVAGATSWTHAIVLDDDWTDDGIYRQYTWCIIENNLYLYRQGYAKVIKIDDSLVVTEFTPSFLNMAGQMGIFRGNGRLCFWDSENSVAWSSAFDLTDFTPSIENMVGNSIFLGVLGRIVMVLPHGEGFVIYSTRSVVGVSYSTVGTGVWDAMSITQQGGIAHPGACCIGEHDKQHYAYTSFGIISIGHYNALSRQYAMENIIPALYDYLKESRDPVYLQCHASRYLYFSVINKDYINGITSFTHVSVPSLQAPLITIDTSLWNTYGALPYISPNQTFQMLQSFLWTAVGVTDTDRTSSLYDAPHYCAIFTLPNFPSQASDMGMFDVASIWKKNSSPTLIDVDGIGLVEEMFENYNVGYDSGYPSIITDCRNATTRIAPIINTNAVNANVHISTNYLSGNTKIWTEEKSFAPKLYPEDITGIGTSVIDLLYNFISTIMEYEKYCADQYALIVDEILAINGQVHVRDFYSTDGNLTITSDQVGTYTCIPMGGVSLAVGMSHANAAGVPSLQISARIARYARIDDSICSRNLLSKVQAPSVECNPDFEVVFVEYWGQNPTASSIAAYFDHMPTMQEVADIMADPAYHLTSTGQTDPATTGHKIQFVYDPDQIVASPYAMSAIHVFGKDQTSNLTYSSYRLQVTPYKGRAFSSSSQLISVGQLNTALSNDNIVPYINQGYPYLAQATNTFLAASSLDSSAYDMLRWMWHLCINSSYYNVTKKVYTALSGIQYQFSNSNEVSYTVLADGAVLLWAYITPVIGGGAYTNEAILVIPPTKLYKYTIEEELIYALIPQDINQETYTDKAPEFTFHLVQTGVDTITKDMFDTVSAALKSTRFVPTVTDPGAGTRLAFTPENYADGGWWHIPATMKHTTVSCTPWALYDHVAYNINYLSAKKVNGQHFMEHAAGTMLGIDQPLGPILSLSDSANACYPDLDADGWITANVAPFTYPGATFVLQDGVPIPGYPTFYGSIVLDTQLKKWGKQASEFKALLQFTPINDISKSISYTNFGMDSGILAAADSEIKLFDVAPEHNFIRYGKIALYRLGFTEIFEVNINFRVPSTGTVTIDGSIDDRTVDTNIQHVETFTNTTQVCVKCHVNAMWHTISISGKFDLQYMEFRGIMAARR